MSDPVISQFFSEKKEKWLKSKVKANTTESEKKELSIKCDQFFSPEKWLPKAAKKAGSRAITTHPSKFSHPSTGIGKKNKEKNTYVTPLIAMAKKSNDGFLRTGNAFGEKDSVGDAAALDVESFLKLILQDGKTLLNHIKEESEIAKELLTIESESYEDLRDGFLALIEKDKKSETSSKIKQVYFPVDNDYHLLSILSNSGLIYELRNRIDTLRFSEEQKELREKKRRNEYSDHSISEIYDITTMGYGGANPQNISVLNTKYGGRARLLLSVPPSLKKRNISFPKKSFFKTSIRYYDIQEPLKKLHNIFKIGLDSVIPRRNLERGRDHRIEEILEIIITRMAALRSVASKQYREESSDLPQYQRIWLCDRYLQIREKQDEWLDELCKRISEWITDAYISKKVIKKPLVLGPAEQAYIKTIVVANKEALR